MEQNDVSLPLETPPILKQPRQFDEKFFIQALLAIGLLIELLVYSAALPPKAEITTENPFPGEVVLPITWGDLGKELVASGVIDLEKLGTLYAARGGIPSEVGRLLTETVDDPIVVTRENAGYLLNLLWAVGLGNDNPILTSGRMAEGDSSRYASTGGWTLSTTDVMEHFARHTLIAVTDEQQALVEEVAGNIYRPCCDNPTSFPDCNHGMAMLGLLELMASQGIGEDEMYRVALSVNALWFADTYRAIGEYVATIEKRDIATVDPKELLGYSYSSASGYRKILQRITPSSSQGSSCGV
ncbi:MAG: hypothetical protein HY459_04115 [Parcubacteria group bacterium]|nr:hypothetical protein [Parcubacteria group bacterium]